MLSINNKWNVLTLSVCTDFQAEQNKLVKLRKRSFVLTRMPPHDVRFFHAGYHLPLVGFVINLPFTRRETKQTKFQVSLT